MIVTLIGYRGTGKSTLAPLLASRLGWDWIDADPELECRAGRSIRAIFEFEGEAAFRVLERELLAELLSRDRLVIAAGGGAVLNADTRREMRAAGPVVWLRSSVDTILHRMTTDVTTAQRRPNLTAAGGRAEIEELLRRREPLYRECATCTIDTDALPTELLVERTLNGIQPMLNERVGT